MTETRYLVPTGTDWALWDDSNGVLGFATDAEVVQMARANEAELGEEFAEEELPPDPTPEQALEYIHALWRGDVGGRGWQCRTPADATWVSLRDGEDDHELGNGPVPTFHFGEPPLDEGEWRQPGY